MELLGFATSGVAQAQWNQALEAGRETVRPNSDQGKVTIPAEWRDESLLKLEWEKAGFKDVTTESVEMEMKFASYEKQIDILAGMPHVRGLLEDLNAGEKQQWKGAVIAKMREYAPQEPGVLMGSVLVTVGRK